MVTKVQEVQQRLIQELQEKGIAHVFNWMDGWFAELAQAQVQDQINYQRDAFDRKGIPLELQAQLIEQALFSSLMAKAQHVPSSTGKASNMLEAEQVAALTRAVACPMRTYTLAPESSQRTWDKALRYTSVKLQESEAKLWEKYNVIVAASEQPTGS